MKWTTDVYVLCKLLNLLTQIACMSAYIKKNQSTIKCCGDEMISWASNSFHWQFIADSLWSISWTFISISRSVFWLVLICVAIQHCSRKSNMLDRQTFTVTYSFFSGMLFITALNLMYSIRVWIFSATFKNDLLEYGNTKSKADIDEVFDRDTPLVFHFIHKHTNKQFSLKLADMLLRYTSKVHQLTHQGTSLARIIVKLYQKSTKPTSIYCLSAT
ncbi:hypothetical protein M3Y98_00649700 [Aphelenchoides besseyi]|nr:hypothetical protein M3Y98_00649700 [Aphelenchoides besseyi]